eukprot:TRINITY_DN1949_c0_g1_i2.p1 TRINITY_DN1949_c0_g1~~TRINITY_DN1949_c0_g1_i2.p1  ORF type:complete len:228 (-),score=57.19 TRINITY_DN1949_c0_g1_i2:139-822(-)
MILCIRCEDWFHVGCIRERSGKFPPLSHFDDFVCEDCVRAAPFLLRWSRYLVPPPPSSHSQIPDNNNNSAETNCLLTGQEQIQEETLENTFWAKDWRKNLCRCGNCKKDFDSAGLSFLLDNAPNDAQQQQSEGDDEDKNDDGNENGNSERGSKRRKTVFSASLEREVLEGMDRRRQVEILQKMNEFSSDMRAFFAPFAQSGREVSAKDVNDFFESKGFPTKRKSPTE